MEESLEGGRNLRKTTFKKLEKKFHSAFFLEHDSREMLATSTWDGPSVFGTGIYGDKKPGSGYFDPALRVFRRGQTAPDLSATSGGLGANTQLQKPHQRLA
ncbi:hypothetical protein FBU30_008181 [Linnemannia zychae]|nr:hypothetical protein FBU30_008181 [Linnemannia zychae]